MEGWPIPSPDPSKLSLLSWLLALASFYSPFLASSDILDPQTPILPQRHVHLLNMGTDRRKQWPASMVPKSNHQSQTSTPSPLDFPNWRQQQNPRTSDMAATLANVHPNQRGEETSHSSASLTKASRQNPSSPPIKEPETQDDRPSFDDGDDIEDISAGKSDYQDSDDTDDSVGDQFAGNDSGIGSGFSTSKQADKYVTKLRQVSDTEFYSNLVFLSILRPIIGPHERRAKDMEFVNLEDPTPSSRRSQKEIQRDFLDRLCYLADFKKGGDSITAAAIEFKFYQTGLPGVGSGQELQQSPTQIIWFAANAGVSREAWDALVQLERLINMNREENKPEEVLTREILEKFTHLASCGTQKQCCDARLRNKEPGTPKGTHRINFYAKNMRKHGKKVCEWLERPSLPETNPTSDSNESIRIWIDDLRHTRTQLELVMKCYNCWYDDTHRRFLKQANQSSSDPEFRADLKEFAHYVARLGAHRYAAGKVAAGIKLLSYFGTNSNACVKFDTLPRKSHQKTLTPTAVKLKTAFVAPGGENDEAFSHSDPWNIIHRLGQRFPSDGPQLAAGYYIEERQRSGPGPVTFSFRDEVQRWLKKKGGNLLTRYHAELQVANFFNAIQLPFQDHDRYIGCSKGACWFCHQYLVNLPPSNYAGGGRGPAADDGFVKPSCHNEVLPGVSFPSSRSDASRRIMDYMKATLNDVVLETIRKTLLGNIEKFPMHHQSTDTWMDRTARQASSWMEEEDIRSVVQ